MSADDVFHVMSDEAKQVYAGLSAEGKAAVDADIEVWAEVFKRVNRLGRSTEGAP